MKSSGILGLIGLVWMLNACVPEEGGTGGTGFDGDEIVSVGAIDSVDSDGITVNGVAYKTDKGTMTLNNQAVTLAEMHSGMIARISGRLNKAGDAAQTDSVDVDDSLSGPIGVLNDDGSFLLFNQVVIHDATTQWPQQTSVNSLAPSVHVAVMGFSDTNGRLRATYINTLADATRQTLSGYLQGLDAVNRRFSLADVLVDYSGVDEQQTTGLANGLYLRVRGDYDNSSNILMADEVEAEQIRLEDNGRAELEGMVGERLDVSSFSLLGVVVRMTADTVIYNGTADNIATGRRLQVKGIYQEGAVVAASIELEDRSGNGNSVPAPLTVNTVTSVVESVDTATSALVLRGLPGTKFKLQVDTVYSGVSNTAPLVAGNTVRINVTVRGVGEYPVISLLRRSEKPTEDIFVLAAPTKNLDPTIWLFDTEVNLTEVKVPEKDLTQFLENLKKASGVNIQGKLIDGQADADWLEADYAN